MGAGDGDGDDGLGPNRLALAQENRLLGQSALFGSGRRVSCTIVTGFLGSGKTTLVQHVLRSKGDLRVAVLVNEFGSEDVDSLLLDATRQGAASSGAAIAPGHAAGGCACCDVKETFKQSVEATLRSPAACDFLIVETSGLADPAPLARALHELARGRLAVDRTVAVVDAEALPLVLDAPVALRQLASADILLLNKCDLVSLGAASDVEDLVASRLEAALGPGVALPPIVRTRFSTVPLDLVLDAPPVLGNEPPPLTATAANEEHGFLSHEASAGTASVRQAVRGGGAPPGLAAGESAGSTPGQGESATAHATSQSLEPRSRAATSAHSRGASHMESGTVASVSFRSSSPLCLARFQQVVLNHFHHAGGSLLRVKGILFFEGLRQCRFVFHLSGKARCELTCSAAWETEPYNALVLISRSQAVLEPLLLALHCATVEPTSLRSTTSDRLLHSGVHGADVLATRAMGNRTVGESEMLCCAPDGVLTPQTSATARDDPCKGSAEEAERDPCSEEGGCLKAAETFASALSNDERFKDAASAWPNPVRWPHAAAPSSPADAQAHSCAGNALVRFGLRGHPLRGVQEDTLNAMFAVKLNAKGNIFAALLAGSGSSSFGPGSALVLGFRVDDATGAITPEPSAAEAEVKDSATVVLRSALKNACACRCDVSPHMAPPSAGSRPEPDIGRAFVGKAL